MQKAWIWTFENLREQIIWMVEFPGYLKDNPLRTNQEKVQHMLHYIQHTWEVLPRLLKHNSDATSSPAGGFALIRSMLLSQVNSYSTSFHVFSSSVLVLDAISESVFLLHRYLTLGWTAYTLWSSNGYSFISTPFCQHFRPTSSLSRVRSLRFLEGSWKAGFEFAEVLASFPLHYCSPVMTTHNWERLVDN